MKKILISAILLAGLQTAAVAQETYENTKVVEDDLNGTARYVGMGGAMEALGADISTISSNPAGIGLFRHNMAAVSFGLVSQDEAKDFKYGNKTNMSFDQVGFVYSVRNNQKSFLNFGFNYHKSKNFDHILSAAGNLTGASQNKLSFIKALGETSSSGTTPININKTGSGYRGTNYYTSQTDNIYYNSLMIANDGGLYYNEANAYDFGRSTTGYIGEYDFNVSGNINDRVYLGLTIGIHDVHYKDHSLYTESLNGLYSDAVIGSGTGTAGEVTMSDERRITGYGYSISGGIIFRPVENSPFRIGLSVTTPTWYDLTTSNYTYLINNSIYEGAYSNYAASEEYDFKIYTPWKFGVSLGHTIGRNIALGASYEYADYSHLDTRINGGSYEDYWGNVYSDSYSDDAMNDHTKQTLKGVSTVKVGMEYKPISEFAFRVGYNYVSPMYRKEAQKAIETNSVSNAYVSTADYTNWEATNRLTLGAGYNFDRLSVDLAYQYSTQSGKFHPFSNLNGETPSDAVKVNNERHQVLLTLGYRF